MQELKKFSPEVCEQLKYYVYRLVDPRYGKTFYVGKGKNNRVFAHAECALKGYDSNLEYDPEIETAEDLKYKTIREIREAGLDVIYIIQKYGLDEEDALKIESVLIDAYSIERKLTNKIKGFDSSEPKNAITLQNELSTEEYMDSPNNPKYIIIKVKDYWLNQRVNRYECTRGAWKINPEVAENYPYVLSVSNGIVREVYKMHEWHYLDDGSGRAEFSGEKAEKSIANIFLGKRIPAKYRKKGQASPFLYCKLD